MIVIYVQKSWLAEIGDSARHFVVGIQENDCVRLLAASTKIDQPFLVAQLARTNVTSRNDTFLLTAHIPLDLVRGIFDLTETEG